MQHANTGCNYCACRLLPLGPSEVCSLPVCRCTHCTTEHCTVQIGVESCCGRTHADSHAHWAFDLPLNPCPAEPDFAYNNVTGAESLAVEFVSSSISSGYKCASAPLVRLQSHAHDLAIVSRDVVRVQRVYVSEIIVCCDRDSAGLCSNHMTSSDSRFRSLQASCKFDTSTRTHALDAPHTCCPVLHCSPARNNQTVPPAAARLEASNPHLKYYENYKVMMYICARFLLWTAPVSVPSAPPLAMMLWRKGICCLSPQC